MTSKGGGKGSSSNFEPKQKKSGVENLSRFMPQADENSFDGRYRNAKAGNREKVAPMIAGATGNERRELVSGENVKT